MLGQSLVQRAARICRVCRRKCGMCLEDLRRVVCLLRRRFAGAVEVFRLPAV